MDSTESKFDVNVPMVMTFVALTAISLLVTIVAVDAWYKSTEAQIITEKWENNPNTWLDNLRKEQRANLDINHRINVRHRHVPVSEAMRILAENNGKVPQ
jgi:hypothetical protein